MLVVSIVASIIGHAFKQTKIEDALYYTGVANCAIGMGLIVASIALIARR